MGDLIVMMRQDTVRRDAPSVGNAQVLFFTGVRYTRMPDLDPGLAGIVAPRRATKPRRGPNKNGTMKRA